MCSPIAVLSRLPGLQLSPNNPGPISSHSARFLELQGIRIAEPVHFPPPGLGIDLQAADLVVAAKEAEVRPLLESDFVALLLESMTWCAVSRRDDQATRKADRGEGQSALGLGRGQPARRSIVQWSVDACCPPAFISPRASIRDRSLAMPFGTVLQRRSLFLPPFVSR
jgi:hypothetical protein